MTFPVIVPSTFSREWTFEVHCPICDDINQHHGDVTTFERIGGYEGAESLALYPGEHFGSTKEPNPSPRRNAVQITFEGECGHTWALAIIQHKGQTFLEVIL